MPCRCINPSEQLCAGIIYLTGLDTPHAWYILNSVCTHLNEMLSLENLSLVSRFSGTQNVHAWRAWYLFYVSIIIKIGLKEKGNVLRIVQ